MAADRSATVLIVEDDAETRGLFTHFLREEYTVRTAASGQEALDEIDETVDVVLLDRRMPGLSGEQTLDRLRDRGYDCMVAMVTAVDPDFDIIEMGFDDYLTKPVTRDELEETVTALLARQNHEKLVREYFALTSKIAALESTKPQPVLDTSDEYTELMDRFASIKQDARAALDEVIESGEFETILRSLEK